jgi:hypothetical protein
MASSSSRTRRARTARAKSMIKDIGKQCDRTVYRDADVRQDKSQGVPYISVYFIFECYLLDDKLYHGRVYIRELQYLPMASIPTVNVYTLEDGSQT